MERRGSRSGRGRQRVRGGGTVPGAAAPAQGQQHQNDDQQQQPQQPDTTTGEAVVDLNTIPPDPPLPRTPPAAAPRSRPRLLASTSFPLAAAAASSTESAAGASTTPRHDSMARALRSPKATSTPQGFPPDDSNGTPLKRGSSLRTRARTFDFVATPGSDTPAGRSATEKGGHSLRKRTRIRYSVDQPETVLESLKEKDAIGKSPLLSRGKKRKASSLAPTDGDSEENRLVTLTLKKRHVDKDSPAEISASVRRKKNPPRRSATDVNNYFANQPDEVQDTIEVGGGNSEESDDAESYDESVESVEPSERARPGDDVPLATEYAQEPIIQPPSPAVPAASPDPHDDTASNPKSAVAAPALGLEANPIAIDSESEQSIAPVQETSTNAAVAHVDSGTDVNLEPGPLPDPQASVIDSTIADVPLHEARSESVQTDPRASLAPQILYAESTSDGAIQTLYETPPTVNELSSNIAAMEGGSTNHALSDSLDNWPRQSSFENGAALPQFSYVQTHSPEPLAHIKTEPAPDISALDPALVDPAFEQAIDPVLDPEHQPTEDPAINSTMDSVIDPAFALGLDQAPSVTPDPPVDPALDLLTENVTLGQPVLNQPALNQPALEQPVIDQPASEKSVLEQPTIEPSAPEISAPEPSTRENSIADHPVVDSVPELALSTTPKVERETMSPAASPTRASTPDDMSALKDFGPIDPRLLGDFLLPEKFPSSTVEKASTYAAKDLAPPNSKPTDKSTVTSTQQPEGTAKSTDFAVPSISINDKTPEQVKLDGSDGHDNAEIPTVEVDVELDPIEKLMSLTPYADGTTAYPEPVAFSAAAEDEAEKPAEDDAEKPAEDDGGDAVEEPDLDGGSPAPESPAESPAPEADSLPPSRVGTPQPDASQKLAEPEEVPQFHFKTIRDSSEFVDILSALNPREMTDADLYRIGESIHETLMAWQSEYKKLRHITDDEENATRRLQDDASYENKVRNALKRGQYTYIAQKEFEVRGIKKLLENAEITYARAQDRIMADAYFFDYNSHENMIGIQNPVSQRDRLRSGRLRDRPKQSARAAEAEEGSGVVVLGKRTRKPREVFEPSVDVSRSATPVPSRAPRRRRGRALLDGDANVGHDDEADAGRRLAEPSPTPTPTPRKRRARAQNAATNMEDAPFQPSGAEPTPEPGIPARKRRRGNAAKESVYEDHHHNADGAPRKRINLVNKPREIPSNSFYTGVASGSAAPTEESRPTTSDSNGSADGAYAFRPKRQRKFTVDEDEEDTSSAAAAPAPPMKRRRTAPKANAAPRMSAALNSSLHPPHGLVMPVLAAAPNPSPLALPQQPNRRPVIKLKQRNKQASPATNASGSGKSSAAGSPIVPNPVNTLGSGGAPVLAAPNQHHKSTGHNGPVPGHGGMAHPAAGGSSSAPHYGLIAPDVLPVMSPSQPPGSGIMGMLDTEEKDYATMTKSEKMSYSMKSRWASGSMRGAVEKRKQTLLKKKLVTQVTTEPAETVPLAPAPAKATTAGPASAAGNHPAPP